MEYYDFVTPKRWDQYINEQDFLFLFFYLTFFFFKKEREQQATRFFILFFRLIRMQAYTLKHDFPQRTKVSYDKNNTAMVKTPKKKNPKEK